jgi:hypothetical protein
MLSINELAIGVVKKEIEREIADEKRTKRLWREEKTKPIYDNTIHFTI